jgi:hypothetical protein
MHSPSGAQLSFRGLFLGLLEGFLDFLESLLCLGVAIFIRVQLASHTSEILFHLVLGATTQTFGKGVNRSLEELVDQEDLLERQPFHFALVVLRQPLQPGWVES